MENPPTPRTTRTAGKFTTPSKSSVASARTNGPSRAGSAAAREGSGLGRGAAPKSRGAPVVRGTRASQLAASRRETIAAQGRGGRV